MKTYTALFMLLACILFVGCGTREESIIDGNYTLTMDGTNYDMTIQMVDPDEYDYKGKIMIQGKISEIGEFTGYVDDEGNINIIALGLVLEGKYLHTTWKLWGDNWTAVKKK